MLGSGFRLDYNPSFITETLEESDFSEVSPPIIFLEV